MTLTVSPVTSDLWPHLETLFGPQGACCGGWHSCFRPAPEQSDATSKQGRNLRLKQATQASLLPGLIAIDEGASVRWVQVTPRPHVARWNTGGTVSRPLDGDEPSSPGLGAFSCFVIRSRRKREGISHVLLDAAVAHPRQIGARVVGACPRHKVKQSKSAGLFAGPVSIFRKAGFETGIKRKIRRPLMRKVLP